jgi:hypothetical protein
MTKIQNQNFFRLLDDWSNSLQYLLIPYMRGIAVSAVKAPSELTRALDGADPNAVTPDSEPCKRPIETVAKNATFTNDATKKSRFARWLTSRSSFIQRSSTTETKLRSEKKLIFISDDTLLRRYSRCWPGTSGRRSRRQKSPEFHSNIITLWFLGVD